MNEILAYIGCACFLLAAFVTDIRFSKIPNKLSLPFIVSGFLYQGLAHGWGGLLFSAKGFAAGFAVLLILYLLGAVGAGDVKLFAGIGAWTGVLFAAQTLLYSILFAAAIGIGILCWRREGMVRVKRMFKSLAGLVVFRNRGALAADRVNHLTFPFMWAVLPGAFVGYFYMYL
ncbi:A24 family peptidase [Saccharibacillus sp. CPCC 101409]|uniref:A24 family peptidase n=1 Tax=Saccharibacillus sp. CPCC 101409 TaxID=3058041 RepID=UPI0026717996|nr:A24 family peptidase [Saccharibacillus sp. CPCC 101409]MDO3408638.1 A24 family peptidase [Saccharibacillus sp. CPCC 101409]